METNETIGRVNTELVAYFANHEDAINFCRFNHWVYSMIAPTSKQPLWRVIKSNETTKT